MAGNRNSTPRADALYRKIIEANPVLSHDEQLELVVAAQQGDEEARDRLVLSNLQFVLGRAAAYAGRGVDFDDLVQEGITGLQVAIPKFDVSQGVAFLSYAVHWVNQRMQITLPNHGSAVRIPLNFNGHATKLRNTTKELEEVLHRQPTIDELAKATGFTADYITDLQNGISTAFSFDEEPFDDQENAGDRYARFKAAISTEPTLDEHLDNKLRNEAIGNALKLLEAIDERDAFIVRGYYGFGGVEQTLEQLGNELGVTRERVRQLRERALKRLTKFLDLDVLKESMSLL